MSIKSLQNLAAARRGSNGDFNLNAQDAAELSKLIELPRHKKDNKGELLYESDPADSTKKIPVIEPAIVQGYINSLYFCQLVDEGYRKSAGFEESSKDRELQTAQKKMSEQETEIEKLRRENTELKSRAKK